MRICIVLLGGVYLRQGVLVYWLIALIGLDMWREDVQSTDQDF